MPRGARATCRQHFMTVLIVVYLRNDLLIVVRGCFCRPHWPRGQLLTARPSIGREAKYWPRGQLLPARRSGRRLTEALIARIIVLRCMFAYTCKLTECVLLHQSDSVRCRPTGERESTLTAAASGERHIVSSDSSYCLAVQPCLMPNR